MHVNVMKLPDTLQRALVSVGYGRKDIEVRARESYSPASGSGDGLRSFVVAVDIVTGQSKTEVGSWGGANMFVRNQVDSDVKSYPLPVDGAVIHGHTGGGKPVYAVIDVNPANLALLLPSGSEAPLSKELAIAISIIVGYKSSARADNFERYKLGKYTMENPIMAELSARGFIKATRAGAVSATTEGRNARDAASATLREAQVYL